ncbi:MAG: GTPase HflX, partial [Cellulomonas sp.]|nr:GTPase HflX [Cellulomonas sp.]
MNDPQRTDGRTAQEVADDVVARVLARAGRYDGTALQSTADEHTRYDGDQIDLEARTSLRRVAGLSTELQDVTEVEYRQLRLERVVLVGITGEGTNEDAEISLRELAALAETAGSVVLDGLLQRRRVPDTSTYLG